LVASQRSVSYPLFVGGLVSYENIIAGNWCVFTSHIAVVSVATYTSVRSNTELEGCSTQTPYCARLMKTLSAGGSAANQHGGIDHTSVKGPSTDSSTKTRTGCTTSLIRTASGTSHGIAWSGRSATVTPSVKQCGRRRRVCRTASADRWRWVAKMDGGGEHAEQSRDMKGCSAIFADHIETFLTRLFLSVPASAISAGNQRDQQNVVKQKMSATGAVASGRGVAKASPGPM